MGHKIPNQTFLKQPINDKILIYTFADAGEEGMKITNVLEGYNLLEHSHIALMSKNCTHWIITDLAIMMAGYVSIPVYLTLKLKRHSIEKIHQ